MQGLIKAQADLDVQDFRPCLIFINGQYFGIQNIREKQAADSVLCFLLPPALLVAVTVTAAPARAEAATGWPDGWAFVQDQAPATLTGRWGVPRGL